MAKTILKNTSAQIVEKKSKFIANIYHVQTQEQAEEILKETRKKYYDARHNCYAYSILTKNGIINKMSDDGEPSGTAGAPMLNIITKNEITNILVIVTRYFGGVLLGTGGLVKAYSEATIKALENAKMANEELGFEVKLVTTYSELEKVRYYCEKNKIYIETIEYDEKANLVVEVNKKEKETLQKIIDEGKFDVEKIDVIKEKNIRKNLEI